MELDDFSLGALGLVIPKLDTRLESLSRHRWDSIAKPLGSLGLLEDIVVRMIVLSGDPAYRPEVRELLVLCADNGVVTQGVTQTDSSVTASMARGFVEGTTSVCKTAQIAHCPVIPIDIGIKEDIVVPGLRRCRMAAGTNDISVMPAMSHEQAIAAMQVGIDLVKERKAAGTKLIAVGEMGIGNTTTSSAIVSVLLSTEVEQVTGRGAGLSSEGLTRKIEVIKRAIAVNRPDPNDTLDVLAKLGGFDIAALSGICLGGALYQVPILLDGFISAVAALVAIRIAPACSSALFASHISQEPASKMVLDALELHALIDAGMRLGEGTGAIAAIPILDMAFAVYHDMASFDDLKLEQYQPLG